MKLIEESANVLRDYVARGSVVREEVRHLVPRLFPLISKDRKRSALKSSICIGDQVRDTRLINRLTIINFGRVIFEDGPRRLFRGYCCAP